MNFLDRILTVLRWIFGILFVLAGVSTISRTLTALVCFALAALLIPPVIKFIQTRAGRIFPRKYKIAALVVLLVILVFSGPPEANRSNTDQKDFQNQAQPLVPANADPNSAEAIIPANNGTLNQGANSLTSEPIPVEEPEPPTPPSQLPPNVRQSVPSPSTPPPNLPAIESNSAPESTKPSCDPNYSGCVPISGDVDCAGGTGNGPAYVKGPVTVIGNDIYDLDGNNDGVACEN